MKEGEPLHEVTNQSPMVKLLANRQCKITELNLSNNPLKIESILCICEALVLNSNISCPLRKLNLSHNEIGPKGCQLISESLKDNTFLRQLNLSYN